MTGIAEGEGIDNGVDFAASASDGCEGSVEGVAGLGGDVLELAEHECCIVILIQDRKRGIDHAFGGLVSMIPPGGIVGRPMGWKLGRQILRGCLRVCGREQAARDSPKPQWLQCRVM